MQLLAHWLFPRPSNNYKAKAIRPTGLFVLLVVVALFQLSLGQLAKQGFILGEKVSFTAEDIIAETNKKREEMGLAPLRIDNSLSQAAAQKGADMLSRDYWAHVSPAGETPWSFFLGSGYQYKYAGENLARDFDSAGDVVRAWMQSPTHRENLLSPKYRDIGVSVVEGDFAGRPAVIVVQHFGTRIGSEFVAFQERGAANTPLSLPETRVQSQIAVSPFAVGKNFSFLILGFLLAVFALDAAVLYRSGIVRISGRTFAHFGFLASIAVILFFARKGGIL